MLENWRCTVHTRELAVQSEHMRMGSAHHSALKIGNAQCTMENWQCTLRPGAGAPLLQMATVVWTIGKAHLYNALHCELNQIAWIIHGRSASGPRPRAIFAFSIGNQVA